MNKIKPFTPKKDELLIKVVNEVIVKMKGGTRKVFFEEVYGEGLPPLRKHYFINALGITVWLSSPSRKVCQAAIDQVYGKDFYKVRVLTKVVNRV